MLAYRFNTRRHQFRSFLAALLCGGLALSALGAESETANTAARGAAVRSDKARGSAVVVVFNRPIVRFRAPILGVPVEQRAEDAADRIRTLHRATIR